MVAEVAADESFSRNFAGAVAKGSAPVWTMASAATLGAAICTNTSTLLLQDDSGTAAVHRILQGNSDTDYSLHMFVDGNLSSAAAPAAHLPLSYWPPAAALVTVAETLRVFGDCLLTPDILVSILLGLLTSSSSSIDYGTGGACTIKN